MAYYLYGVEFPFNPYRFIAIGVYDAKHIWFPEADATGFPCHGWSCAQYPLTRERVGRFIGYPGGSEIELTREQCTALFRYFDWRKRTKFRPVLPPFDGTN